MNKPCGKRCEREGLAVLATIYAIAPKKASEGIASLSSGAFADPGLSPLLAHEHVLRVPRTGYFYVLYPNKRWAGYTIDPEGATQYYPDLTIEDVPESPPALPLEKTCGNVAHPKTLTKLISIESPQLYERVWLAYSRTKWTKSIRDAYSENAKPKGVQKGPRDERMFELDLNVVRSRSAIKGASVCSRENLQKWVLDYMPMARHQACNEGLDIALLNRSEQADAHPLAARQIGTVPGSSKEPLDGLIVALNDAIGVSRQAAHTRNRVHAEIGKYSLDEVVSRKQTVAKVYRELEKAAKAPVDSEGQKAFAEAWAEKYSEAVQVGSLEDFEKTYKSIVDKLDASLKNAAKDWVDLYDHQKLKTMLLLDYDDKSLTAGLNYATEIAEITFGAGAVPVEAVQWIPRVASVKLEENLFLRAMVLNQAALLAAGNAVVFKDWGGGTNDSIKNLLAAIDEWHKDKGTWVKTGATHIGRMVQLSSEGVRTGLSKLFATANAIVGRHISSVEARYVQRATVGLSYILGAKLAVQEVALTARQLELDLRAMLHGEDFSLVPFNHTTKSPARVVWKADVQHLQTLAAVGQDNVPVKVRVLVLTEVQNDYGKWVKLSDDVMLSTSSPEDRLMKELLNEVASGTFEKRFDLRLAPTTTPKAPGASLPGVFGQRVGQGAHAVASGIERVKVNALRFSGKTITFGAQRLPPYLTGCVGIFQGWNVIDATMKLLDKKVAGSDRDQALGALLAGSLGFLGAICDAWALAAARRAGAVSAEAAAKGGMRALMTSTRLLPLFGGVLGGVSGIVTGYYKLEAVKGLADVGDDDAALRTKVVGTVVLVSGVIGTSAAVASAAGLTLIPIVGWAILLGVLAVAALAGEFWIAAAKDDPLEAWLKRSILGIAPAAAKWANQKDEMDEYSKVMGVFWSSKAEWKAGNGWSAHILELSSAVPSVSSQMRLEIFVALIDFEQRVHVLTFGLEPSKTPGYSETSDWKKLASTYGLRVVYSTSRQSAESLKFEVKFYMFPIRASADVKPVPIIRSATIRQRICPDIRADSTLMLPDQTGKVEQLSPPA